jgi:hypothetical protein
MKNARRKFRALQMAVDLAAFVALAAIANAAACAIAQNHECTCTDCQAGCTCEPGCVCKNCGGVCPLERICGQPGVDQNGVCTLDPRTGETICTGADGRQYRYQTKGTGNGPSVYRGIPHRRHVDAGLVCV